MVGPCDLAERGILSRCGVVSCVLHKYMRRGVNEVEGHPTDTRGGHLE